MKIVSGILILITAFLNFKHGWEGFHMESHPGQAKMMEGLGIGKGIGMVFAFVTIAIGIMILFPQTFFLANLLNAISIIIIMALALKTGNLKMVLIEIPFLLMPLVLIYLGHPFKK